MKKLILISAVILAIIAASFVSQTNIVLTGDYFVDPDTINTKRVVYGENKQLSEISLNSQYFSETNNDNTGNSTIGSLSGGFGVHNAYLDVTDTVSYANGNVFTQALSGIAVSSMTSNGVNSISTIQLTATNGSTSSKSTAKISLMYDVAANKGIIITLNPGATGAQGRFIFSENNLPNSNGIMYASHNQVTQPLSLTTKEYVDLNTLTTASKTALPSASISGRLLYVGNATGGPCIAFSDGSNWRRISDNTIIN